MQSNFGNPLGSARAEADEKMLNNAFVETHDFKALAKTNDFNFVVGRRGTGKTALFIKVAEYYENDKTIYLYKVRPEEYATLAFRSLIENLQLDYNIARAICRVCWKTTLLMELVNDLKTHWKLKRTDELEYLIMYMAKHKDLLNKEIISRLYELFYYVKDKAISAQEIPGLIANHVDLPKLQKTVQKILENLNRSAIFLFDDLDEGWLPSNESIAILGGLSISVADFRNSKTRIHSILFIRDNIFRSLAAIDPDFSKHIEGNTLRLHWEENSLFHFIAQRLRVFLSLQNVENDTKVWNRFAYRNLKEREGFRYCLRFTLYRPRDILVLLNQAYIIAARSGRNEIIDEDIENTARQIANDRLKDLINEYTYVFPGLGLFIESFKGRSACINYNYLIEFLNSMIDGNPYDHESASDFAILNSGIEAFNALYSVGFLGLQDQTDKSYTFCHDGSRSDLASIKPEQKIIVHPCYWKALDIIENKIDTPSFVDINDEYSIRHNPNTKDLRIRMLGQLVSKLPLLPIGQEGCRDFEDWVFRTIKILFSGDLQNPELKPNGQAIQRRDIVATNMAEKGFWRRILEDYKSRQIIFEVKNYENLDEDDFRQALSYSGKNYGNFIVMVYRSSNENLSEKERGWVKEMYYHHDNLLIFLLPASVLTNCLQKLRNPDRRDYSDNRLSKRLDMFIRSYICLEHHKRTTRSSRKMKRR